MGRRIWASAGEQSMFGCDVPWLITNNNYVAVAQSHLGESEQLIEWKPALRGLVVLTNRRLLVSDFPWFGSASLLFEAPLFGLTRSEASTTTDACQLRTEGGGLTRNATLPLPYHRALTQILPFVTAKIAQAGGQIALADDQKPAVLQTMECEGCGASLTLSSAHVERVTCVYCRRDQIVTDRARSVLLLDSQLAALLLQARAEIASTLYFRSRAVAVYELTGAGLGMALAAAVATVFGRVVRLPGGLAMVIGVVLAIVFGVLFVPPFHMIAEQIARSDARRMAKQVELRRAEAKCVGCGAPIQIPGGTARLDCAHCSTPLLVAEGLVAMWKGDSAKAIEQWRSQASALVQGRSGINVGVALMLLGGVILLLAPTVALFVFAFSKK